MKWMKHHPCVCTFFSWASCGVTASKPFKASKLSGKKTSDGIWFLMIFLRPVVLRLPTCRWLVAKCQGPQFGTKHAQACDRHPIPTNSTAASCILLAWRTLHSADSWYSCGRVGCHFEASGWIYMEFAYIWPLQTLVSRAKSDTMPVDPNPAMFGTGPADGMTNGGRGDSRAFEPPYHGTIQAIPGHSLIICYC